MDRRVIYCGDNLEQLQKLPDACVDLIYIDPSFNSNRNYEVGSYLPFGDSPVNFGIEQKGKRTLEIWICNWCGHVELFRPDYVASASPARVAGA